MTRFNTEKFKQRNERKKIAYRILQVLMGVAITAVLYIAGCVAEFPDWTAQQWSIHFLWLGIAGGTGLTAWVAAIFLGWTEGGKTDGTGKADK